MQPSQLTAGSLSAYPPEGRSVAVENLAILRRMPLSLLPLVLAELKVYDAAFPAERHNLQAQLRFLANAPPEQRSRALGGLRAIRLPRQLTSLDWVEEPGVFAQQLSAALWATQQMDAFQAAAREYQQAWQAASPPSAPVCPRVAIAVIGKGATQPGDRCFQKLKVHGCLFSAVRPTGGLNQIFEYVARRAARYPTDYGHWYIEGGALDPALAASRGVVPLSYAAVVPVAQREMQRVAAYVRGSQSQKIGAEQVRSYMANLSAGELGIEHVFHNPVMERFATSILTEGSGTQIFSTSFVQWAARESLRRAEPLTVLTRYAPRQQSASMNQLLVRNPLLQPTDPEGSLLDGEMGAYYTWINLQRLPGAEHSQFIAWYEDHSVAIAVSSALPRNTVSSNPATLQQIFEWAAA